MDTWEVVADHSGATASEFHGLPFALIALILLYRPLKISLLTPNKKTLVFPDAENEGFLPVTARTQPSTFLREGNRLLQRNTSSGSRRSTYSSIFSEHVSE